MSVERDAKFEKSIGEQRRVCWRIGFGNDLGRHVGVKTMKRGEDGFIASSSCRGVAVVVALDKTRTSTSMSR